MRRLFYLLPVLLVLGGCGSFSTIKTGSKTVTDYDKKGHVVRQTQTEQPMGDTQTIHGETVRTVAHEARQSDEAVIQGYVGLVNGTADKATTPVEAALTRVVGFLALKDFKSSIPASITAVGKRPLTVSEVFLEGVKELAHDLWTIPVTVAVRQQGKSQREALKNAGDVQTVSGDGNTVLTRKTRTDSVVHANTTGQSSPTNVNNDQKAAGCPDGNCGSETSESGIFNLDSCLKNPPAGFINGRAQYTPTCSCASYAAGHCK